jgi:hypothetical protein
MSIRARAGREISAPGTEIYRLLQLARDLDGPTDEARTRVWARLSHVLGLVPRLAPPPRRPFTDLA